MATTPGPTYAIAALRASILSDCTEFICDTTNLFTPILRYATSYGATCAAALTPGDDDYETIIANYVISNFNPHCQSGENECDGCEESLACPD